MGVAADDDDADFSMLMMMARTATKKPYLLGLLCSLLSMLIFLFRWRHYFSLVRLTVVAVVMMMMMMMTSFGGHHRRLDE